MYRRSVLLSALTLLLVSACATGPRTSAVPVLERMQQAATDFAGARAAGDALDMALAAVARRPFDALVDGTSPLTSAAMFAEARRVAAGDRETLAKIAELDDGLAGPFSNLGGATGQLARLFAERDVPFTVVEGGGAMREQQLGRPPSVPSDCGSESFGSSPNRVLTVGAKSSVVLCGAVRAERTLFVYVEGGLDARLVLRVFDLATAEQICAQDQPNPLCKWPPRAAATRAVVEIDNPSEAAVSVTLIAHQ